MKNMIIVILMIGFFGLTFAYFIYPTQWAYFSNGYERVNRFSGCAEHLFNGDETWSYVGSESKCMNELEKKREYDRLAEVKKREEADSLRKREQLSKEKILLSQEPSRKAMYDFKMINYIKNVSAEASIVNNEFEEYFMVEIYNPQVCSIKAMSIVITAGNKNMEYEASGDVPRKSKGVFYFKPYGMRTIISEGKYSWYIKQIGYDSETGISYDSSCYKE